jgi:hypothetical protein
MIGEAYRRTDDPYSDIMSVDYDGDARIKEYWSVRNITDVGEAVENLTSYLEEVETPPILAKLLMHGSLSRQVFLDQGTDTGLGPQFIIYLLGVSVCRDPSGVRSQYYDFLREATAVSDLIMIADKPDENAEKTSAAYNLAARELTLAHLASPGQYIEAARRFYEPHSQKMESEFGFSIDDAITFVTSIRDRKDRIDSNLYEAIPDNSVKLSILDRIIQFRSQIPRITDEYIHWVEEFNSFADDLAQDSYWTDYSQIVDGIELCDERIENILDHLSVRLGEAEGCKDPSDHNPLDATPIIEYENEYLLPPKGVAEHAIATTFKYQLRTENYGDEFNEKMGDAV